MAGQDLQGSTSDHNWDPLVQSERPAGLWFESLQANNLDWPELQILFRQQYSKLGNTRKQLFHAWRSFHFDENTNTIDAYAKWILTRKDR